MCSYCQSFDHDASYYPYYNISNEWYAKLNAITETLNERHKHFVSEIREYGLFYNTGPRLSFARLNANLHNDCDFTFPLEPNFIVDITFTSLEKAFDPPLTSLPFVAISYCSTPRETTVIDLILCSSPPRLA